MTAPDRSFTPTMTSSPAQMSAGSADANAVVEMLLEQHRAMIEDAKAEMEKMREEATEARDARLRDQQLVLLQGRLEKLHSSKLLTDEEMWSIEDLIGDSAEGLEEDRVGLLIALSARMAADAAFARQLRRKVVP